MSLKEFTGLIFDKCPGLEPFRGSLEEIYAAFNAYKRTVPVRGCILLDPKMEKCLLVRGFKRDAGWGFPRGKLSLNETDAECAVREVMEETGFDCSLGLREDQYIEIKIGDQATKLFIVPGVDESTPFAPHVRGEIGAFGWHVIAHLPSTWEEGRHHFVNEQGGRHKFFNVWPYMKQLKSWIARTKKGAGKGGKGKGKAAAAAAAAAGSPAPPPPPPTAAAGPGKAFRSFAFDHQDILKHVMAACPS